MSQYDIEIFKSKEWLEYQAALQAFADVFTRVVNQQIEIREVITDTLQLQKQVLLNNDSSANQE